MSHVLDDLELDRVTEEGRLVGDHGIEQVPVLRLLLPVVYQEIIVILEGLEVPVLKPSHQSGLQQIFFRIGKCDAASRVYDIAQKAEGFVGKLRFAIQT